MAGAFYIRYPGAGGGSANPSVGPTGVTAPTSATEIGGINPSGDLEAVHLDSAGNLKVSVADGPQPNSNGLQVTDAAIVSGAPTTFSPPANAVGFILEAESSNTDSLRWAIVSTPTTSSGMLMEPGRDTGYVPCAADVLVIAVSGTQAVGIQWVMSV